MGRGRISLAGLRHVLPAPSGVPPMSPGEGSLLSAALHEGGRVFWHLAGGGAAKVAGLEQSRAFLFRRWVLEAVLVLRLQGPTSYNALSRILGGPAGESLSPKLGALCEAGLASRSVTGRSPLRVEYALTAAGLSLGSGVYTLTRWKGLHALASHGRAGVEMPTTRHLGQRVAVSEPESRAALARYLEATAAFLETREAYCRPKEFDEGIATARRFCRAWVHKWHREVLQALALNGPMSFGDLKRALGAGDQALAGALAGLVEMRSIGPVAEPGGKRYAVAAFGWADLALSAPLGLLVLGASGGGRDPGRSSRSDLTVQ